MVLLCSKTRGRLINGHVRPYYTTTYGQELIINLGTFVTYVFRIILLKNLINRPIKLRLMVLRRFPSFFFVVVLRNREFEKRRRFECIEG